MVENSNNIQIKHGIAYPLIIVILLVRYALYLDWSPSLEMLLSLVRFALFPLTLHLFIKNRIKPTWIDIVLLLYATSYTISTAIKQAPSFIPIVSQTIDIFMLWSIIRYFFSQKDIYPLRVLSIGMSVMVYVNFLLILLFPDGIWYPEDSNIGYFLLGGNYNQMGKVFITGFICNYIYYKQSNRNKLNTICMLLIASLSLLIVGSKTSLVGLIILLGFTIIPSQKLRQIGLYLLIIIYIGFHAQVIFQGQEINNKYATYLVEDILQKDLTFTHRTYIWALSGLQIIHSPIWGYGYRDQDWYKDRIGSIMPHNYILSTLMKGGIVLLIIAFWLVYLVHRRYKKHADLPHQTILIGLWVILFMMMMEVYYFFFMAILYILAGYIHLLQDKEKENNSTNPDKIISD